MKKRPGRIARNARRKAAGKQRPVKAFIQRSLARMSKKLFGYNIFQKYFDSPRQPKGTKPNPPYNATPAQAPEAAQTPLQGSSLPRGLDTQPTSSLSSDPR